jgi:hypothetical protein
LPDIVRRDIGEDQGLRAERGHEVFRDNRLERTRSKIAAAGQLDNEQRTVTWYARKWEQAFPIAQYRNRLLRHPSRQGARFEASDTESTTLVAGPTGACRSTR